MVMVNENVFLSPVPNMKTFSEINQELITPFQSCISLPKWTKGLHKDRKLGRMHVLWRHMR